MQYNIIYGKLMFIKIFSRSCKHGN